MGCHGLPQKTGKKSVVSEKFLGFQLWPRPIWQATRREFTRFGKHSSLSLKMGHFACSFYKGFSKKRWSLNLSGWWFATCFIFPYIGNSQHPSDFHIFQRVETTDHLLLTRQLSWVDTSFRGRTSGKWQCPSFRPLLFLLILFGDGYGDRMTWFLMVVMMMLIWIEILLVILICWLLLIGISGYGSGLLL